MQQEVLSFSYLLATVHVVTVTNGEKNHDPW